MTGAFNRKRHFPLVLLVSCAVILMTMGRSESADKDTKKSNPEKVTAEKADEKAEKAEPELTDIPTVKWLPKPFPVENASAKTESEMKDYVEQIPGTDLEIPMVSIPSGKFLIGSPKSEADREKNEGPQAEVEIEPFWMGKYEMLWEPYEVWSFRMDIQKRVLLKKQPTHWDQFADAVARPTPPYTDMAFGMGRPNKPAICMTQFAAKMFCKWLSAKTGRYYRLPTEAEWEYACRAGTTTAYSFGDDPDDLDDYAWHFDNSEDEYHDVGQKKPNPWGLYDMHGNVAEWTLDQLIDDRYKTLSNACSKGKVPFAVPKKLYPRVVRGGSWDSDPEDCRSAARMESTNDWKKLDPQIPQSIWYHTDASFLGFRVVRPLRIPTEEESRSYEPDPKVRLEYIEAQGGKL